MVHLLWSNGKYFTATPDVRCLPTDSSLSRTAIRLVKRHAHLSRNQRRGQGRHAQWRQHSRARVGNPKTERSKAPVPVIRQLADRLQAHWIACGRPAKGPIFANSLGKPLDLDALYRRQMKDVLERAGVEWVGWHGFRRGLASNLNRLGVDDSVIQAILRHSNVSVTQRCYIKTVPPDAVAAMRQLAAGVSELKNRSEVGIISAWKEVLFAFPC
jgi:Phage integrase family